MFEPFFVLEGVGLLDSRDAIRRHGAEGSLNTERVWVVLAGSSSILSKRQNVPISHIVERAVPISHIWCPSSLRCAEAHYSGFVGRAPRLLNVATGGVWDLSVLLPKILGCWGFFARAFLLGRLDFL